MRFVLILLAMATMALSNPTVVWIDGLRATATTDNGRTINFKLDPEARVSSVRVEDAGANLYTLAPGVSWSESNVNVITEGEPVLAIGPDSAFMRAVGVVTINPSKGKMTVGAYDASGECRESPMAFTNQLYETNGWTLYLDWDAQNFGVGRGVHFLLALTHDDFIIPRFLMHGFWRHMSDRLYLRRSENRPYTLEEALLDVPVINIGMGEFHTELRPQDYMAQRVHTVFDLSDSRSSVLPSWLVKRWVLQFDSREGTRRIGVCLPH